MSTTLAYASTYDESSLQHAKIYQVLNEAVFKAPSVKNNLISIYPSVIISDTIIVVHNKHLENVFRNV